MTLQARIRDVRSVRQADLDLSSLCLLAGRNRSGKSSIANAVAAALTGTTMPLGLTKKGTAKLVRDGAEQGGCRVKGERGTAAVVWPAAEAKSDGEPPRASLYAVGLRHVMELDAKARAQCLAEYLKTAPTQDDLSVATVELGLSDDVSADLWKLIDEQGWDAAHSKAKDKGARLKGKWETIAGGGATYGSKLAANWTPEGWDETCEDQSAEEIEAALKTERQKAEGATVSAAVDAAEIKRLTTLADSLATWQSNLAQHEKGLTDAEAAFTACQQERDALPPSGDEQVVALGLKCPHCEKPVEAQRNPQTSAWELRKPKDKINAAEQKKRRDAIASADGKLSKAKTEVADARHLVEQAKLRIKEAEDAAARIATIKPAESADVATKAKERAAYLDRCLTLVVRCHEAAQVHETIQRNQQLVDLLAPDGLRKKKLGETLAAFNGALAGLCEAAGWDAVALNADLVPTWGGRDYWLLCESEQYMVRAVLQVAMAGLDRSELVVVDRADVLDSPLRNGLIKLLQASEIPALVCMTASRVETVPDLGAAGIGASYWLEAGEAKPLGEAPAKAAA